MEGNEVLAEDALVLDDRARPVFLALLRDKEGYGVLERHAGAVELATSPVANELEGLFAGVL